MSVENLMEQINQERVKRIAVAKEVWKPLVFDALVAAGLASVVVEFDGEGDDGQINDVSVSTPAEPEKHYECPEVILSVDGKDIPLRDAIEDLCYRLLDQDHSGWEENNGSFGEFTFDVESRKITLVCNVRYTDSSQYNYEF